MLFLRSGCQYSMICDHDLKKEFEVLEETFVFVFHHSSYYDAVFGYTVQINIFQKCSYLLLWFVLLKVSTSNYKHYETNNNISFQRLKHCSKYHLNFKLVKAVILSLFYFCFLFIYLFIYCIEHKSLQNDLKGSWG